MCKNGRGCVFKMLSILLKYITAIGIQVFEIYHVFLPHWENQITDDINK
jgi:hypothetical protein